MSRKVDELTDVGYSIFDSAGVICLDLKLKTIDGVYEGRNAFKQLAMRAWQTMDEESELKTGDFMEMFVVASQGQFFENRFKLGGVTMKEDRLVFEFLKRKSPTRFDRVSDEAAVVLIGTMGRMHVRKRPYNSDIITVEWRNGKIFRICKDIYFNPAL